MDLAYVAACALAAIVGSIILLTVLIKSFKHGGIVHGILGVVTAGLYTFFWGWLKAKPLQMTKQMLLCTMCFILVGALVYLTGPLKMLQSVPYAAELGLIEKEKPKIAKLPKKFANKSKKDASKKDNGEKKMQTAAIIQNADWNTQAVSLWKNDRYSDSKTAVKFLDKAVEENPSFVEAYNNRGNAHREMKQYDLALNDYNKAISLDANFFKAYNNRGNVYYDQGNYQMAVRDYNIALHLNSTYSLAYLNRGLAYHRLKNDRLACQDFTRACEFGDCEGISWAKKGGICK
jgi:tetratricopeptide (TPR) repeat protein